MRPGSPELQALLARIAEGASERERDRTPPYEQIKWIRDAGLGRLRIPVEEGGAGASLREFFQVLIDLAAADSNVAHILRAHFWFVEQQLQSNPSESRKRWLTLVNQGKIFGNATSEQVVSKWAFFETKLTPNANGIGYRINGQKYYSTGSLYSDWIQIYASTPEGTIAGTAIPVDREPYNQRRLGRFWAAIDGDGHDHSRQRVRGARGSCRLRVTVRSAAELSVCFPSTVSAGTHRGHPAQCSGGRGGAGASPAAKL